jgi:carboxyl-terminal processing protease
VPLDTVGYSPYYRRLFDSGNIFQFAIHYADTHRDKLKTFGTWQTLDEYLSSQPLANLLAAYAESKGVPKHYYYFNISHQLLSHQLKAYIIRNMLGNDGFYPSLNQNDVTVKRAIQALNK